MSSSKLSANILSFLGSASPSPKTTTKEKEMRKVRRSADGRPVLGKSRATGGRDGLMVNLVSEAFIEAENIFRRKVAAGYGKAEQS